MLQPYVVWVHGILMHRILMLAKVKSLVYEVRTPWQSGREWVQIFGIMQKGVSRRECVK